MQGYCNVIRDWIDSVNRSKLVLIDHCDRIVNGRGYNPWLCVVERVQALVLLSHFEIKSISISLHLLCSNGTRCPLSSSPSVPRVPRTFLLSQKHFIFHHHIHSISIICAVNTTNKHSMKHKHENEMHQNTESENIEIGDCYEPHQLSMWYNHNEGRWV